MWSHQLLFRLALETIAQGVVSKLGIKLPLSAWLVGWPSAEPASHLCVESEDRDWTPEHLSPFPQHFASSTDKLRHKKCSTLSCSENLKRRAYQAALKELLEDQGLGTVFVGYPEYVDRHLVAPVIRISATEFDRLPRPESTTYAIGDRLWKPHDSLLDAALFQILDYASEALKRPQPGRDFRGLKREYVDICRSAAKDFMYRVAWAAGGRSGLNLFECCNEIASLYHEGVSTRGRLLCCHPSQLERAVQVEFRRRVPITETGWSRKLVAVSSNNHTLVVCAPDEAGLSICGIGAERDLQQVAGAETFIIDFTGHHKWQVNLNDTCLMHVRYGIPSIPSDRMDRAYLERLFKELFPQTQPQDVRRILTLADAAIEQRRGTMLVISKEAEAEAERLESQGTSVTPTLITPDLVKLVTSIDGAVLLDPQGLCYGVGVILDGPATPQGSPARGARYNSAIRYLSAHPGCLIIAVSEDGPVDIFPQRQASHDDRITQQLLQLKELRTNPADDEDMTHSLLQWLNEHRSYFQESQCGALDECVESLKTRWGKE